MRVGFKVLLQQGTINGLRSGFVDSLIAKRYPRRPRAGQGRPVRRPSIRSACLGGQGSGCDSRDMDLGQRTKSSKCPRIADGTAAQVQLAQAVHARKRL